MASRSSLAEGDVLWSRLSDERAMRVVLPDVF